MNFVMTMGVVIAGFWFDGAWISVPPDKILKQSAPDLGFHVCAPFKFDGRPDHLYCVVVPPET